MATRTNDLIPVSLALDKRCKKCNKEDASEKCGHCKTVCYCDKLCQKEDWSDHKNICKLYNKPVNKIIQFIYFLDETIILNYIKETFKFWQGDPKNVFSAYIDIKGDITNFISFDLILLFNKSETNDFFKKQEWDTSKAATPAIDTNVFFVFFFNFDNIENYGEENIF